MKLNKCHLLQGPEGPVGPRGNRGLQVNLNFISLGIKSTVKTSHNALKNDKKRGQICIIKLYDIFFNSDC